MSKDPPKKGEIEEQTESQEITGTLTDLGFDGEDAGIDVHSGSSIKRLLGSRSLRVKTANGVLLMPEKIYSRADLLRSEKIPDTRIPENAIFILGPFSEEQLARKASEGLMRRGDRLLMSGNRWKPVLEEFPEWSVHISANDEFSRTVELTQTKTKTLTTEMPQDNVHEIEHHQPDPSSYELEDVEEPQRGKSAQSTAVVPVAPAAATPAPAKRVSETKTSEPILNPRASDAAAASAPAKVARNGLGPIQLTLTLTAVIAGVVWYIGTHNEPKPEVPEAVLATDVGAAKVKSSQEWPASLKPRTLESLYSDENPMIRKVRPVLRAYEAGVTVLNQGDELLLRRYADPASANWEVRKLASNQLAVHMMVRSDLERAKSFLRPILQADAGDFDTLVNLSLVDIWEGRFASAREALRVASRINPEMRWLTLALLGVVEGNSDRWPAATSSFEDSLKAQPNNPYIQGLWLQTLMKSDKSARGQVQKLVSEALWSDPDSLIDSPLAAPLASHLVHSEALDGLLRGAESLGASDLSAGQLAYVRWLKGRATGFSTSTPSLAQVVTGLENEESLQSQVLFAYALKEQGRFEEASQVLTKVLPLIESQGLTSSSWPWTLAGDVQLARSRYDQSILFYQGALNRNNLDYAAVYGLAMTLRDRGQYVEAEQKIREAQSLQPAFMPARLRVSRLEWQGLARSQ